MNNALIIGYGSIGQLHYKIIKKLNIFKKIYIYTSQQIKNKNKLNSLNSLNELNLSYVIIASPTSSHLQHLIKINNQLKNIKIVVEKPLFYNKLPKAFIERNKIYVGYDLRYHPILTKIKKIIKGKRIWSANAFCGSYLPNWRPGRNYSKTSSALKKLGGGVLNDLSHEFDYLYWLFGESKILFSYSDRISNLRIDTDDTLIAISKYQNGVLGNISLNYYTRVPERKLIIDGNNISISADLIKNKITYSIKNKVYKFSYKNIKRETTQQLMHKNIISSSNIYCSEYKQAIKIQKIINLIRSK